MTSQDPRQSRAPRPTAGVLFWRTFLPWQMFRFAAINLRMFGLMRRSHAKAHR